MSSQAEREKKKKKREKDIGDELMAYVNSVMDQTIKKCMADIFKDFKIK